jgi:hypothetical protein
MKPFLLFAGDSYYPSGGWGDFQGAFATREEAVAEGERRINLRSGWQQLDGPHEDARDWYNVADALTLEQVAGGHRK